MNTMPDWIWTRPLPTPICTISPPKWSPSFSSTMQNLMPAICSWNSSPSTPLFSISTSTLLPVSPPISPGIPVLPPPVLSSTHLVIVLPTTCLHPTMSRLYVWCIASTGNSTNYPNPSSLPSNSTTNNSSGMTLTSAPIRSKRNNSPTFSPGSMKTLKSRMTSSTTFSPMPSCQSTFWVWPENWTCWNPRRPKTFTSRTSKIPVPS